MLRLTLFAIAISSVSSGSSLLAANASRTTAPRFYFDTQFALTTVKSKMLLSNDTGTALRYGWGTFTGDEGQLNIHMMNDMESTTFALNDSSLQSTWHDASLRAFLGPAYLGIVLSHVDMKASNQAVETIDAAGFGYGGTAGIIMEMGRQGSFHLDLVSVSVSEMKNVLPQTVAIEQRLDVDLGASTGLGLKWLDFTFGYRVRNLSIKTDASYAEAFYHTYGGIRVRIDF